MSYKCEKGSCSPAGTEKHPCFSFEAHTKYARIHLPVAPKCNISCNYCNRRYDCVNESRPGVTSEVLTPELALAKYKMVKEKIPQLSVVGIAGPGDALANWDATRETLELIRQADNEVIFCLSTNGLMLPEYAEEIMALNVKHVTVTMNCIEPEIGAKLYRFVNFKGQSYTGVPAAELLLANQLKGIEKLVAGGTLVKINIVMVKDINDYHIPEVVAKAKELKTFITNIMPLIPAPGSAFEHFPQTNMKEVQAMRAKCELDMRQMHHCKQCRADAIGLLGEDRSHEFRMTGKAPEIVEKPAADSEKYYIAVTSKTGTIVDQHFGHATEFKIYESDGSSFNLVEKRKVKKYCTGADDCDTTQQKDAVIGSLSDCTAVVTMRIGSNAKNKLLEKGIMCFEYCDSVSNGLVHAVNKINDKKVG